MLTTAFDKKKIFVDYLCDHVSMGIELKRAYDRCFLECKLEMNEIIKNEKNSVENNLGEIIKDENEKEKFDLQYNSP